jgi:hypothetical protein
MASPELMLQSLELLSSELQGSVCLKSVNFPPSEVHGLGLHRPVVIAVTPSREG